MDDIALIAAGIAVAVGAAGPAVRAIAGARRARKTAIKIEIDGHVVEVTGPSDADADANVKRIIEELLARHDSETKSPEK